MKYTEVCFYISEESEPKITAVTRPKNSFEQSTMAKKLKNYKMTFTESVASFELQIIYFVWHLSVLLQ